MEDKKTCSNCKFGEPVLANTRVWCHGDTPFASIQGLSMPKTFYCSSWRKGR